MIRARIRKSGNTTAAIAARMLVAKGLGYVIPSPRQKKNLVVAYAKKDKIVYGKAFDVLRLTRSFDLDSIDEVESRLNDVLVCEIKSTNQDFPDSFQGYFFGLTAAEVLVSQSLRDHYRFIFVNITTGKHLELPLNEVFAKARGIYPTWSISF